MKHIFGLKSKDPTKQTSILYKSHFNGGRFVYGTGVKIYPESWDHANQEPTKNKALIKEYKAQIPNLDTLLTNIVIRLHNITSEVEGYLSNSRFNFFHIKIKKTTRTSSKTIINGSNLLNL